MMTIAKAAEVFGVERDTIRKRLNYDRDEGNQLYGCEKQGRVWIVTEQYMKEKWNKKT